MDSWIFIVIGVVLVGGFIVYKLLIKKKTDTPPINSGEIDWSKQKNGVVETSQNQKQTSPKGVTVYSDAGISNDLLILIDESLDEVFEDAKSEGYTSALTHSFYDIFIPKFGCMLSPISQTPSFMLRADVYDGTEYDVYNPKGNGVKDGIGVIYAAEKVLNIDNIKTRGQMICCNDISIIKNSTRHGAEHIIIANNDKTYWDATWFHDTFQHPLLPKQIKPVTLKAWTSFVTTHNEEKITLAVK